MTDIQPLINELAKLLVPSIVEHLEISEYMSEDIGTMVNNYIGEGYVDDIINDRIEEVMSNGCFDVEVTYHA